MLTNTIELHGKQVHIFIYERKEYQKSVNKKTVGNYSRELCTISLMVPRFVGGSIDYTRLLNTFFHECGHALAHLINIPVIGYLDDEEFGIAFEWCQAYFFQISDKYTEICFEIQKNDKMLEEQKTKKVKKAGK